MSFIHCAQVLCGNAIVTVRLQLWFVGWQWYTSIFYGSPSPRLISVLFCVHIFFVVSVPLECARFPVFSEGASSSVAVPVMLASVVISCVTIVSVGSFSGVLIALFGCLVGLFITYVHEIDVNKHTQQVKARIAWQVENFLWAMLLDFLLLFVAKVG